MTVQDTPSEVTFVGTGVDTSFPFVFRVDDVSWLSVDYLVNFDQFLLNADQDANPGGSVEYTVAPPNLQELTVTRLTPLTQDLDYTRYDPFDSESHEDALDKLTMEIQDRFLAFSEHISDTSIHFADAPANGSFYSRRNNGWEIPVPIFPDAPADGQDYVRNNNAWALGSGGISDHFILTNIGVNTHVQIDTHIADGTIHFLEGSIDHLNILNIGTNSHAVIDLAIILFNAHIADTGIHVPAGTVANSLLRWDGATNWIEETQVQVSAAGLLSVFDAGLTQSMTLEHDGTDFIMTASGGTVNFDVALSSGSFRILGGNNLVVLDSTGTAGGVFSHDTTNFLTSLVGTTVWGISGAVSMELTGGMDLDIRDAGVLSIRDATDAGLGIFFHDTVNFNTMFVGTSLWDINGADVRITGGADLWVRDGGTFSMSAPGNLTEARFFDDGVDFNTTFFGAQDWNITSLLGSMVIDDIAGGTVAGSILDLAGSTGAPDTGIVRVGSPVTFTYDTVSNTTPAQQFLMNWSPTVAASAAYIGGCLQTAAVFTVTSGVFIPAIFSDTNRYNIGAAPGFSAITFINELSVVANSGNFNLPSALVMNIGLTHERNTAGTSTTPGTTGISFSPQTRATIAGAVMTKTDQTAVRCSVTYSTVGGSTVNLGTIRALHLFNPAVALFQPAAGAEAATAIIGVDVNNLTFGGNIVKAAVRSAHISTGTNSYFLLNTGTAVSDFGSSNIHFNDLFGVSFGTPLSAPDLNIGVIAGGVFFLNWTTGDTGQLRMSSELPGNTTDRFLWTSTVSAEYTFDCDRFSIGAQTGSNGNTIGAFVAPASTVGIGGDFSQFLLTQAGNVTVNAALGALAGWTINAPAITLGTGSVTTGVALNVGGNPNQGTNRIGVRIISNPTGGGGVNAALWVTAGRAQFDGFVDINKPVALGGGAAPTLGTIGGAGPTAAAQAQWIQIEVAGVNHWVPVWT